jgi:hypothetical protein
MYTFHSTPEQLSISKSGRVMDENPFKNPSNPYPYGPPGGPGSPEPPKEPQPISMPDWKPMDPPSFPAPYVPSGSGMPPGSAIRTVGGAASGDFVLNLIFVGFLWELWVCLYPLPALAGLYTLVYAMRFLRGVLPPSPIIGPGLYAVVLGSLAAAIVLWSLSRLEHVVAHHRSYRIARHLVRLPLLGMVTIVAIQKMQRLPYDPTPSGIAPILKSPTNLAVVLGVMLASHFILWNWKDAREFWHRRLSGAQLRKRGT